ncbi:MAG: 50S ribosomal protein L11 methyltransferase [Oxalobacter sp.]|nr:50S ribosomal protein L11 methyltransferase [Oxalobacter sp.]
MSWTEIVIEIGFDDTVSYADALMDAGALSVTVEDRDEGTPQEKPMFDEPGADANDYAWENSRIIALVEPDTDIPALTRRAADACGMKEVPAYTTRDVPDEDWVRLTQSQFDPIHIGKNIWIVPSWHDSQDKNGVILELDPGLAFGTGSHPTTSLCLEWLEQYAAKGKSILDYGCGSGILAIAAVKLGIPDAVGVDIDPQSIIATQENAERNATPLHCWLPDTFETAQKGIRYDIVIANILAGPLQTLVPVLVPRVKPNGYLVLSGILESQADDVIAAYAPYIRLSVWRKRDGWVALMGQANPL